MIKVIKIRGTDETYRLIEKHADNARQAVRQTFFRMGRDLQTKTIRDINNKQNKTGRRYIKRDRIGRKLQRRRSAPGETHANDSFALRKSLGWKVTGSEFMEFGYGVTRSAPEHAQIEDGYGNVKPRPTLKNNLKNVQFETFFEEALRDLE